MKRAELMTEAEAVERFRPFVYKTARKFARPNVVDFDDLMQEGLLAIAVAFRAWRKRGGASMLTWIHRPVWWRIKRVADAHYRNGASKNAKTPRIFHVSMDAELGEVAGADGTDVFTLHEVLGTFEEPRDVLALQKLPRAMASLTPRERKIIRLRFVDGLTHDEVGRKLGFSRELARQLERDALAKMRSIVVGEERAA